MNRREFLRLFAWSVAGISTVRCAARDPHAPWVLYDYYSHIHLGWNRVAPGIDYRVSSIPPYTEIVPCASGWVWDTGWDYEAGEYITVSHGLGYFTMYAHLKERFVTEGAPVDRSSVMALGGNTGKNARGVWHLHLGFLVPEYAWHEDYQSPGGGKRWANPDAFSENGQSLEFWWRNDLDMVFQRESEKARESARALWQLLADRENRVARLLQGREEIPFDRRLSLLERMVNVCHSCLRLEETPRIREELAGLKNIRPTLTLPFTNPALRPHYVRPLRITPSAVGTPEQPIY